MRLRPAFAASLIGAICLPAVVAAQAPPSREALRRDLAVALAQAGTSGQKIHAKPGDLILVENADRVRIVRRREAQLRAIHNGQQRWLVLLVDYASPGADPDGQVDASYRYEEVTGDWPLGERWDGRVVIDDYSIAGEGGLYGIGFSSPGGLVQVLGPPEGTTFRDPSAIAALSFRRMGRGGQAPSFDVAEQQELARLSAGSRAMAAVGLSLPHGGSQPVRVGGNIRTPVKLHDVRPVYPDEAMKARITGLVILEAIIGVDGTVTEARVLRSIPMLDAAAVDAVKQWRFEPTLLNGTPVPVIMTVTVNFALQ
jgi:TonB family protein